MRGYARQVNLLEDVNDKMVRNAQYGEIILLFS